MVVVGRLAADQDRTQEHKIAELGMDQVAVNTHVAEAGFDGDRLMRNDPSCASPDLVHLHGKSHGRIHSFNVSFLKFGDDRGADFVHFFAGPVEFQVGDRSRRATHRFACHPADKTQQSPGPGIIPEDLLTLRIESGTDSTSPTWWAPQSVQIAAASCLQLQSQVWPTWIPRPSWTAANGWVIFEHLQPPLEVASEDQKQHRFHWACRPILRSSLQYL